MIFWQNSALLLSSEKLSYILFHVRMIIIIYRCIVWSHVVRKSRVLHERQTPEENKIWATDRYLEVRGKVVQQEDWIKSISPILIL